MELGVNEIDWQALAIKEVNRMGWWLQRETLIGYLVKELQEDYLAEDDDGKRLYIESIVS